jgi:hypothetical protein
VVPRLLQMAGESTTEVKVKALLISLIN